MKPIYAMVAVAVMAMLLPLISATSAGAADNGSYSVFPTATAGAGRSIFQFSAPPGSSLGDAIVVANKTDQEVTLNLFAADAVNTADGGLSLRRRTDDQLDSGKWIQLAQNQVTLPPMTQVAVPFTITIPLDASPGDHVAGIAVEPTVGETDRQGDVAVTTLNAVGTRVYTRVSGDATPSLDVTSMKLTTSGGLVSLLGGPVSADLSVEVSNTGNVVLKPDVKTIFEGLGFSSQEVGPDTLTDLLPGQSATITRHVDSIWPFGRVSATVELEGQGAVAVGSTSALVVPWLLLLIIAGLIVLLVWRRRRRNRSADIGSGPGGPQAPVREPVSV